ncbi:periplasmic heavy metal sensor [Sphingomonas morindae]|uniref:Periplasmic heavy metal sensor n=1 Tax=Sphingomonas morindae TaxID=1541170 RepID=A0ABY4XCT2_9SPHN|nr:periplasmic heavy metal sensor [Sphingomonas morindae]USI74718.1 periplasmic heavy metal sensor [Sphingomonas morindae]
MSHRLFRLVCAASILLNLFLLGAALGGAAWLRAGHGMIGAGAIRVAGTTLPPDARRAFRGTLRTARAEMRAQADAGQAARAEAAALLRAPRLDTARLAAALARVRAADYAIRAHLEARAIAFAATLPADQRARLADGLERRRARAFARAASDRP